MEDKKKSNDLDKLIKISHERSKELAAINQTVSLVKEGKSIDETLQKICYLIPNGWQYPEQTIARIIFNGKIWTSNKSFNVTKWRQFHNFTTIDGKNGSIEIYYTREFPLEDEGPFLKEERSLLNNLANIIAGYINSEKGKTLVKAGTYEGEKEDTKGFIPKSDSGFHLMHQFLRKINADRDVYHDLMPFKVKEILLVATLYNAFNLELENSFSNEIFSEYHYVNYASVPRITGVSSYEEAMDHLNYKHFDLIIVMIGVDKEGPFDLCEKIKSRFMYIPIYLLLNHNHEKGLISKFNEKKNLFDRIFAWNGNSKIFFTMVKHLEDASNAENDTKIGLVNVILILEDSLKYYSEILPVLYDNIMVQTRKMIDGVSSDEIYKLYRLRTRPKILLATNYEEARYYFNKYKDYLLCVISDVELEDSGPDNAKGFEFVQEVKEYDEYIPVIIDSSDDNYQQKAFDVNAFFINKNSESLLQDILSFVNHQLGFSSFISKSTVGEKMVSANSIKEFEKVLHTLSEESLIDHARKFHYSLWLRARGEIAIARKIHGVSVDSFKTADDYRQFLVNALKSDIYEKEKGRIVSFSKETLNDNSNIVSMADGLLGGKGRGLAFINTLINNIDLSHLIKDINITIPRTTIIGTDEFDAFLHRNNIGHNVINGLDDAGIKKLFIRGQLSDKLMKRLEILVSQINKPLAFRSSGLLEDSINQPFAGIFETYIIPNNQSETKERLQLASDAVKLVFASVYAKIARSYIKAVGGSVEGERMAVIVQEVVGNDFGGYFYPHISGVAQSYNYYPVSHMSPEDGFAIIALGLGKYVVEGEKTFRFAPDYPEIEISSIKDQYKNSQTEFFAVDLNKSKINLLEGEDAGLARLDLYEAEKHGVLRHLASVYDVENDRIIPGLTANGPRVINFANILKYNYIPLASTIRDILKISHEALGCPSEIEFAVDLNKDSKNRATFYMLQIKPLVGNVHDYRINKEEIHHEKTLIYAEKGMGNGLIEGVSDLIYVDPATFDKKYTEEMAEEIDQLNSVMIDNNRKYVLLGPGRWGTRDKWIGIPVNWPQISNAKVIIEYSMKDFPLDASLGSHFFHNLTANNIGYFSIIHDSTSYIKWDRLLLQNEVKHYKYFKHIKFENELTIKIDGKERIAIIAVDDIKQ